MRQRPDSRGWEVPPTGIVEMLGIGLCSNGFRGEGEQFAQFFGAVGKDFRYVRGDEEFLDEPSAVDCVFDLISYQCAVRVWDEGVLVNPAAVGAPALLIDEGVRRIPRGNLALPTDGYTAKLQAVVE